MKRFLSFALLTALAAAVASAQSAQVTGLIAIRGVTLIDGTGRAPLAGATVVIEGNRIREAGRNVDVPAGARTIDGSGKFLIPGLIDAHIHLRGGRGSSRSAADQERDGVRALHSYLYAGVTTVFDAGNRPEYIMDLRTKERAGAIVSPRIFATGGTVASPNGHGGPYNVEAWPADRKLLDQHLATKPDLAKIGQDEHGWGTRPQINGRHSRD
jgi:imidazolonepropionase-like amidohydrolase